MLPADSRQQTADRDDGVANPARRKFLINSAKLAAGVAVGLTIGLPESMAQAHESLPQTELETLGRFHPEYPPLNSQEIARTLRQITSLINNREDIANTLTEDGKILVVNSFRRVGLLLERDGETFSPRAQFPTGLCVTGNQLTDFAISKVESTETLQNHPVFANGVVNLTLIDGQSNPDEIHGNTMPRSEDRFVQTSNSSLGCIVADHEVIDQLTSPSKLALNPNDIVVVLPDDITDLNAFFSNAVIKPASEYYSPLGYPPPPNPGSYESAAFSEYINTQEAVLEMTGPVVPDSDLFHEMGYAEIVTVNLKSGEVNLFERDESNNFLQNSEFKSFGLVGERLPRRRSFERYFNEYYPNGEYRYDRRGILYRQVPDGEIPRATLTPPAIFDLNSFTDRNGFGGTPSDVSTRYMVLNPVLRNEDGSTLLSDEESPYTLHEIPPVPDERSRNFANRRRVVREALQDNSPVEDPFWSHGCVNVDQDFYTRLQSKLQQDIDSGKQIAVIFSYPDLDQSKVLDAFPSSFSFSYTDPLTGDNLRFLPSNESGIYQSGEPGSETFESEISPQFYLDLRNLDLEAEAETDDDQLTAEARQFINYCGQFAGIPDNQAMNLYDFAEMPQQGHVFNQLQQGIRNVLYTPEITHHQRGAMIERLFERIRHYQRLQLL